MGRPRSFDEDEALDRAMHLFWKKGFEGASLQALTHAMGIKPASLYAAFGNKQQLFRRALDRYHTQQLPFTQKALDQPTAYAVAERLLVGSALFLTRRDLPRRCLTLEVVASSEGAGIYDELIVMRNDSQEALRRRFARAKSEGDLPRHANPASLARFVTAVCQGMNIQSISGASRRQLLDLARTSLLAWPK